MTTVYMTICRTKGLFGWFENTVYLSGGCMTIWLVILLVARSWLLVEWMYDYATTMLILGYISKWLVVFLTVCMTIWLLTYFFVGFMTIWLVVNTWLVMTKMTGHTTGCKNIWPAAYMIFRMKIWLNTGYVGWLFAPNRCLYDKNLVV